LAAKLAKEFFTLPHRLAPLLLQNKKVIYDLLFRTSAETLLEVARDPKHFGAEIGFFTCYSRGRFSSNPLPSTLCHRLCCAAQPRHTFTSLLPIIEFP
jgi:hypothetical protein